MKYGSYGHIKAKVDPNIINKRKKLTVKQKNEIDQLKVIFSNLSIAQIESTYKDQKCDFESALDLLTSIKDQREEELELLQNMFPNQAREMIQEIYESCDKDIQKATAFLIEANSEIAEEDSEDSEFGNSVIG